MLLAAEVKAGERVEGDMGIGDRLELVDCSEVGVLGLLHFFL
jgi:hypothetical protein